MTDRKIQILALRTAADLLELTLRAESVQMPELSIRNLLADEPTLREAVFDTAGDIDQPEGVDLFEPSVFAQLFGEVRTLLVATSYGPVPR